MIGHSAKTVQTLHKVVGVSDLYAWGFGCRTFSEIHPLTIKRLLTGDSKADKETVAAALIPYVGPLEYACDDESDAVAVGVAFLLREGMIDAKNTK